MYLWLGINKHKKEVLKGLPLGYEDTHALRKAQRIVGTPPKQLMYTGNYMIWININILFTTFFEDECLNYSSQGFALLGFSIMSLTKPLST